MNPERSCLKSNDACLHVSLFLFGPWREIQWERLMRAVSGVGIWPSEVKFLDRPKTIISESIRQVHSFSIKNESRGIEDDQIPS